MYNELRDNEKVIVNEEKGTVTVKSIVYSKVYANNYPSKFTEFENMINRYIGIKKTFVGVARLKDNDISNIEFAKKIAENKMERQFHKYIANCVKEDISNIEQCMEYYKKELSKHTSKAERCNDRIVELCSK